MTIDQNPFIRDDGYTRGGVPMTKEEVRWISLIKLEIAPGHQVLDIGAGTGSVAIGAAKMAHQGVVTAVERNPEGVQLIRTNCEKLGVSNVRILEGMAPEVLASEGHFDRIFIGGSGGNLWDLIGWSFEHLNPSGKIGVTAVTPENTGEAAKALKAMGFIDIETIQIAITRGKPAGGLTLWDAQNPVVLFTARKG